MSRSNKRLLILDDAFFGTELKDFFSISYLVVNLSSLRKSLDKSTDLFLKDLLTFLTFKGAIPLKAIFLLGPDMFEKFHLSFHQYFLEKSVSGGVIAVVGALSKERLDWIVSTRKKYIFCPFESGIINSLPLLKESLNQIFILLKGFLSNKGSILFEDLNQLIFLSQSLAQERNFEKLLQFILDSVVDLTFADGGSIYLVEHDVKANVPKLVFQTSCLDLDKRDGDKPTKFSLPIDKNSIAGYVAYTKTFINIEDVYNLKYSEPYVFNPSYDQKYFYHTKSILAIPLINKHTNDVIGVIQLINRKKDFTRKNLTIEEMKGDEVISFSERDFELSFAVACQATVAIQNQIYLSEQRNFLTSFIELIAEAIDLKSEHTGNHCRKVPELVKMLLDEAIKSKHSIFENFNLNEDEVFEVQVAAWLHDCGKIIVPDHIMDKATKLNLIGDEINEIILKIELLRKDAQILFLEKTLNKPENKTSYEKDYNQTLKDLEYAEEFLCKINIGSEFLEGDAKKYLNTLSSFKYNTHRDGKQPLLTQRHLDYLFIERGTLAEDERLIINSHMVSTVNMLDSLPFPSNLSKVPEYACGHHEKFDGKGYPKGIFAGDMSLPARMVAIADVFEALTSRDRPYKKTKKLSECMNIMGKMKEVNHLDPELFNLFVSSGVYLSFAKKFLSPEQLDEVDEQKILSIKPKKLDLPEKSIRDKRWESFLPDYKKFDNSDYKENMTLDLTSRIS